MIGIDEVGCGAWAGPLLVVAARKSGSLPKGLTDSKLLSRPRREALYGQIIRACQFGEGWVSSEEIDSGGLAAALRLGASRALEALDPDLNEPIILDGSGNYLPTKFLNTKCVIRADLTEPIVSAASVYAKVRRDRYMQQLAEQHLNYGFDSHVGYGTRAHLEAITANGILRGVHRLSFKPVNKLLINNI